MMHRFVIAATVATLGLTAYTVSAAPESTPGHLDCFDGFTGTPIDGGVRLECVISATTTTSTTVAPTTTTTAPPTTTTTAPPATTTTAPPTTTPPADPEAFVEHFTGNTGLERFEWGIFHRDGRANGTELGDHDHACGDPSTQRVVSAADPSSSFYVCRDHLMTAVGDWTAYSVAWFSPDRTFSGQRSVSWDVNVTDLGNRQWFEVAIVPAGHGPSVIPWLADVSHLPGYPTGAVVVGNGPFGRDVNIWHNGPRYSGWQPTCGAPWALFGSDCDSKAVRRTFTVTDNGNGTISVDYGGAFVETFPGSFPSEFRVIFKDHNYTPNKDLTPIGHTWHWDAIEVR